MVVVALIVCDVVEPVTWLLAEAVMVIVCTTLVALLGSVKTTQAWPLFACGVQLTPVPTSTPVALKSAFRLPLTEPGAEKLICLGLLAVFLPSGTALLL
jgi:hypothetical protein